MAVHLDCQDEDMVREACLLPFDSIMVDMSHHSKEENLARTKQLVAYCHEHGKAVEAELGRIEGGEDGVSDMLDLAGLMTSAEEAQQFVDAGVEEHPWGVWAARHRSRFRKVFIYLSHYPTSLSLRHLIYLHDYGVS